jgi:hypothetical protein
MTKEEKAFIEANMINFESVKLGFTRNIPHDVLAEYERLYRAYLDPYFALTYYCSSCVFDMIKRLSYYYDSLPIQEAVFTFPDDLDTIQPVEGAESLLPKKRGRKPKA